MVCNAGVREFLFGLEDTRNTRATRSVVSLSSRAFPKLDGSDGTVLTHHISEPYKSSISTTPYNLGYTYIIYVSMDKLGMTIDFHYT